MTDDTRPPLDPPTDELAARREQRERWAITREAPLPDGSGPDEELHAAHGALLDAVRRFARAPFVPGDLPAAQRGLEEAAQRFAASDAWAKQSSEWRPSSPGSRIEDWLPKWEGEQAELKGWLDEVWPKLAAAFGMNHVVVHRARWAAAISSDLMGMRDMVAMLTSIPPQFRQKIGDLPPPPAPPR